jgi:L,D-transpeptidase ErfK/SrfK
MIKIIVFLFLCISKNIFATTFLYPELSDDKLIGNELEWDQYTFSKYEDTLLDIARQFNIGQNEIVLANPTVDRWLPGENTKVRIPNKRLLPNTPHKGLVLNLPEFRLYYYPKLRIDQARVVITHPISIGRIDWNTPLGKTKIISKTKNPIWTPPKSIKAEHAAMGEILPAVYPAGPDNPLGRFALYLGMSGYLIHGTNKPYGVGMRVSHGCIRMYPEDIEKLFSLVNRGTSVRIVNQTIKVGWSGDLLYIEVYPELEGHETSPSYRLSLAWRLIKQANNNIMPVLDDTVLKLAIQQNNGLPVAIFERELQSPVPLNHHQLNSDKYVYGTNKM